jgi:hypothetical protein
MISPKLPNYLTVRILDAPDLILGTGLTLTPRIRDLASSPTAPVSVDPGI